MAEILERLQTMWVGLILLVVSLIFLYVYRWLASLLILPWMKAENQQKRQEIMKETKGKKK